MSVVIHVPTVLRRFTENRDAIELRAATVREALTELANHYPSLQKHLFDSEGRLRSFVNVYLGEHDVRHLTRKHETVLSDGDVLTIIPSIAGGTDSPSRVKPVLTKEGSAQPGRNLPELSSAETKRYSRHLILPEVGVTGQRKLKAASVLVIGAGGLGSPLLAYLAAAGVGRIGIVDRDVVDETNLQRQIIHGTQQVGKSKLESARAFIQNLNPNVQVDLHETFLSSENAMEIAGPYDILIDGTDNFPTRYLVNDVAFLLGKPNVYGSIFRFEGQASVFCTKGGPCYRCLYPEPPPPGLVPSCAEGGVLGVLPGIIGSIQANEAIKLILGIGETLTGRLLRFDALKMSFREFVLKRDGDCPLCGDFPRITAPIDYQEFCGIPSAERASEDVAQMTVKELHARLQNSNGNKPFILDIRIPEELEIAAFDGAYLIPMHELDYRMHEIPREQDVVIICRSGRRSAEVWHQLRGAGFDRIWNLYGGILAWADEIDPTMQKY